MCSCSQPAHMKAVASSKWAWLQSCCTCRVVTSSITCYHMHSLCHSVHLCHNQLQWDSCTVLESLYISTYNSSVTGYNSVATLIIPTTYCGVQTSGNDCTVHAVIPTYSHVCLVPLCHTLAAMCAWTSLAVTGSNPTITG